MSRHPFLLFAVLFSLNDAAWIADIDQLVRDLPRLHLNAFGRVSREQFESSAASLKTSVPSLSDDEVLAGVMRLVASVGDAHTTVSGYAFTRYPIRLDWFTDGIFVTQATVEQQDLLGARVTAIDGHAIDDALSLVAAVIPHENDAWLRELAPDMLVRAEVLHGLGMAANFTFILRDGTTVDRHLVPSTGTLVSLPPADSLPLYLRDRASFYWYEYLPREETLYLQYNVCADQPGRPFSSFLQELNAFAATHVIRRFVIDLRHNTGGSSGLLQPLISGLQSNPPEHLYVLIDRTTFSSAMINAIDLDTKTKTILVGEETGGKPNAYGEVQSFLLANTRLRITYSTKFFTLLPGIDPPSLAPEIRVPLSSREYFEGRDPVLTFVLPHPRRRVIVH
ncbi:MAG TPA: hypothetical protein VJZ00_24175 [Thermoanaerobaculia bacterium]|nr:hypothetical protein [Thermoanaerobaculia bacterium]